MLNKKPERAENEEVKAAAKKEVKPDENILNILRRIILRLRPYMSPSSSPALAFKALQIFENLSPFLNDKPMTLESDAKGMFATEDQANV